MLSPSGDFGVCFTLSDDGYIGLQSVTFLDFKHAFEHTETILNAFPMGKLHMPTVSSGGSIRYCDKKLGMQFNLNLSSGRSSATLRISITASPCGRRSS